jgi:hypothetical protein
MQAAITLSLSPEEKAELDALAEQFDLLWGDRPNISGLIRAIARKQLIVHRPEAPISESERAYHKAQLDAIEAALGNLRNL